MDASTDESRYRRIVELTHEGVCTIDAEGHYTFVNHRMESMLGYEPGTMLGKHLFELMDATSRELADRHLDRCRQKLAESAELKVLRKDGQELWLRFELSPLVRDDGAYEGAIVMVADTTERRANQQAKEKLQGQLILTDRMASVGTLAAGVGHEINNPLAYIISNLEVVAEEIRELASASPSSRWHEIERMIAECREGADRVRRIVRGLRTFSRADEDRRVLLDVRAVLDMSINLAINEIKHRARLVKEYAVVPLVESDESRLGQVFVNLLVNAAHAIPEGNSDANEIRLTTAVDAAGRVVVEVRDTGRGIPKKLLGRIFDPFFTTKPVGEGTGLGLAICHGIVGALGGEITVESQIGKGTTFRVAIPQASADAKVEVKRPASMRLKTIRSGRVLVIDDDPNVGAGLRRVLRDHELTVTLNGQEALDLLRTGAQFDVILCDLMMPVMTGMALYVQLAAELPALAERMIFITGGAFTHSARAFLDEIPNERIEKPYEPQNLRQLVQRFIK